MIRTDTDAPGLGGEARKDWPSVSKKRPIELVAPGTKEHQRLLDYVKKRLEASESKMSKFYARWRINELRDLLAWSAATAPFLDEDACSWGLLDLPDTGASGSALGGPQLLVTSPARPPIQARLMDAGPGPIHLQMAVKGVAEIFAFRQVGAEPDSFYRDQRDGYFPAK